MGATAQPGVALLDGQMPEDVDEVLGACGVSLFPRSAELTTSCSCPDWANPCKHVAAVHYVLAQTFDADPFLLPRLRDRDQAAMLAGLRAAPPGWPRLSWTRRPSGTASRSLRCAPVSCSRLGARWRRSSCARRRRPTAAPTAPTGPAAR
ncbi:MAG: SWIM zinc finger family protein, partial [Egibacteraceae bacterium]